MHVSEVTTEIYNYLGWGEGSLKFHQGQRGYCLPFCDLALSGPLNPIIVISVINITYDTPTPQLFLSVVINPYNQTRHY